MPGQGDILDVIQGLAYSTTKGDKQYLTLRKT